MAVTLSIPLTDAQQALMVQVANSVLPEGSTAAQKKAWAEQVAADGLRAEIERIAFDDITRDANEQVNSARTAFLESAAAAWPEPVEEEPAPE